MNLTSGRNYNRILPGGLEEEHHIGEPRMKHLQSVATIHIPFHPDLHTYAHTNIDRAIS